MAGAWSVSSLSRVRAAGLVWERAPAASMGPPSARGAGGAPGQGAWFGTIVCKATFALRARGMSLAPEQEPIFAEERPFADGTSAGLGAPPDLVPLKTRVDVVLVGHAAPAAPCRQIAVRLALGELDKRLDVWTDRVLMPDGNMHEAQPFAGMPIVYERAAAGPDRSNPVGVRADARDAHGRRPVPNLFLAGGVAGSAARPAGHACFAPVAATWSHRVELLGSTTGTPPSTWDGATLPHSVDPLFFNAAPRDQQLESLASDAPLVLENLVPGISIVSTRLPGLGARAFVWGRRDPFEVPLRLDTVCVFSARSVLTLTFRAPVPLASRDERLEVVVGLEDASRPMTLGEVTLLRGAGGSKASTVAVSATEAVPSARGTDLPFAPSEAAAPTSRNVAPVSAGLPFAASPFAAPRPSQPSSRQPVSPPALAPQAPPPQAPPPQAPPPQAPSPQAPSPQLPALVPARPAEGVSPWAGGSARTEAPERLVYTPVPVAVEVSAPAPVVAWSMPGAARSEMLVLSGVDPAALAFARRTPVLQAVFAALADAPLDPDLDDPTSYASPEEMEDQREALEILANGPETALHDLGRRLSENIRDDGRTLPLVALVSGELSLPFDALARLRATLGAAAPYVGADPEAAALAETVRAYLASPGLPGAPAVAEGLVERLEDTLTTRGLATATALRQQAERVLFADRSFERKTVLGAPHTRGEMRLAGAKEGVTVYLPASIAARLPSSPRVAVKLLATVHPAQDPMEPHRIALRAAALALIKPLSTFGGRAAVSPGPGGPVA